MTPWWNAPDRFSIIVRLIALTAVAGCAPALPQRPIQRALVHDVQRIVDVRTSVGWIIDDTELQSLLPDALKSACQTPSDDRLEALAWLDAEIAAKGGDVAEVWRARGRKLGAVDDLLLLTRARLLLGQADQWVRQGKCPFWMEPTPRFAGIQTHRNRWVLTLEAGGRVVQAFAVGKVRYGGGGSGRVLIGHGIGEEWILSVGPELGGDAMLTKLELGQVNEFPALSAFLAIPVVVRWRFDLAKHVEAELGPVSYVNRASASASGNVSAHYHTGVRTGVALGGTLLRLGRGFVPKFSIAATVDLIPAAGGSAALTQVGIGLRTGVDLSSWREF